MSLNLPNYTDTKNQTANALSAQVKKVFDALQKSIFAKYQVIPDVDVAITGTTVSHALKRVPTGYLIIKRSNGTVVYDTNSTNKFLELKAAAEVTVTIVVF